MGIDVFVTVVEVFMFTNYLRQNTMNNINLNDQIPEFIWVIETNKQKSTFDMIFFS